MKEQVYYNKFQDMHKGNKTSKIMSNRARVAKSSGSDFKLYLVEGSRDEIGPQYSYCYSREKDPRTFDEAMQSRDAVFWKEAINDEMDLLMKNNTWILSDLLPGNIFYYQVVKQVLRGRLLASFQDLEHEGGDTRSQGGMKFKDNDLKIKIQDHRHENNESKIFPRTRLQVSRKADKAAIKAILVNRIGSHTWLPDAIESPTSVSALIHAATMGEQELGIGCGQNSRQWLRCSVDSLPFCEVRTPTIWSTDHTEGQALKRRTGTSGINVFKFLALHRASNRPWTKRPLPERTMSMGPPPPDKERDSLKGQGRGWPREPTWRFRISVGNAKFA
nr:zinc finger, CCHC-type [Tanacetum cinerariifolium]